MKFIYQVVAISAMVSSVSATPTLIKKPMKRDVDVDLIPKFGVTPGQNPSGTGNCDGIPGPHGAPIQIPCGCPPDRNQFAMDLIANVAAGHCVNNTAVTVPAFPNDNSTASQLTRLHISTITLQNLHGPGQGCPQSSTTWAAQANAIQNSPNSVPPPATSPPATALPPPSTPSTSAPPASTPPASTSGVVDDSLIPQFGVTAGQNPTGTGNCDGITGPNAVPIQIPCGCPPDRNQFVADLIANVAAGHCVNNTAVTVPAFPNDNSTASQLTRLYISTITLQNLHGPGQGCPQSSTTWAAQVNAVQNSASPVPPSASSPPALQ